MFLWWLWYVSGWRKEVGGGGDITVEGATALAYLILAPLHAADSLASQT
jgi:hypothetical protein